jgi:hypothetical protein
MISILDVETQEQTIREMNDAEFAQYEIDKAAWEAELAARNAE